ncbi:hypothetical protein KUCAC02_022236 [Chaenocephalus aceratus]|nr:hypothetical protein KUCAC02_022236 [Chaenocephalus aceratus]
MHLYTRNLPSVSRVTEYISSLEHTHFSDGSLHPSSLTPILQQEGAVDLGAELSYDPSTEASELGLSQPVIQPLSIQELLRGGSLMTENSQMTGNSLMTGKRGTAR